MTPEAARSLTEEVKADAAALWGKLLALYEGEAHTTLGYSSWGAYYEEEFGARYRDGYRVLEAARVVDAISDKFVTPPNESVARELVPVLRDAPEQVEEVWGQVVELHGETPTAAQVRETVQRTQGQLANQSGGTDEWATPQNLFDALHAEFDFNLDVCALPSSAKCQDYFTPEADGLAHDWQGTCWMNPPYGRDIDKWIAKAADSAADGATVVCLVPARVDTGWWWDYCRFAEIRFLRGRLRFGEAESGAPFPSALVVFRPEQKATVDWWEWQ